MTKPFARADDINAIRGVILAQIEALLGDDAERAFSFASKLIQDVFGTPDAFLEMVRTHYSAVYRPQRVVFRHLVWRGETGAEQFVHLLDKENQQRTARYELSLGADGWRISGCMLDGVWGAENDWP